MYPPGWKTLCLGQKNSGRTFVSLAKTVFSPFDWKKQPFFLRKQKFASQFFCPWHNVSSQKEHIFPHPVLDHRWECLPLTNFGLQPYSEVPNRRADRNKRAGLEKSATLLAYLLSKLINEQGGIFRLLHEKLRAGWKENLKNLSEHALLLGTLE